MQLFRTFFAVLAGVGAVYGATFGTVVPVVGGATDIVLDEVRQRLYLVNNAQNRIDVYSTRDRRFLDPIRTDGRPLTAAISRDGRSLYVVSFDASNINVVDLDSQAVANRVSLPVRPEGVAVGGDGRVLITTIGTGVGNQTNALLRYNPAVDAAVALEAVSVTLPPPQNPQVIPPSGRVFLTSRSQMVTSADGQWIIGVNLPNNNARVVFVYEVASGTVLRTRTVANATSILSVAPDGSRFMAGLTLFHKDTLSILAQQNTGNAPFPYAPGTNFNIEQNQGGSVFSPDGSMLYSAFNIAPIQNPPARANVSQMLINDPDNLLIRMGLQMPENLAGKMVISSDGGTVYALSESGFVIVPMGTLSASPIASPERTSVLLVNDYCGFSGAQRTASVTVRNEGRGRVTGNATLLQAGAGVPGGPVTPNPATAATAPQVRPVLTPTAFQLEYTFTGNALARAPGTVFPAHTFVVSSNEAVNIPAGVQVYQNFREPEARGEIVPIQMGLTATETLEDMVLDSRRQRIYIANSALNRVEVFDMRSRQMLPPINVGQLPRSLALSPDGLFLYLANTGGETLSVIDLDRLERTKLLVFPPLPANVGVVISPAIIAVGLRGPQVLMNNGQLWRLVGEDLLPRPMSPVIGAATVPAPRSMAATPGGEFIFLLAGNGVGYLYDATSDEFVQRRQIFATPLTGLFGPVAAGPRGQYFVANGLVLNQALSSVGNASTRPTSAVAALSTTQFIRFTQPLRANANTPATDVPAFEIVDVNTGAMVRSVPGLEGPPLNLVGTTVRANLNGRLMVADAATNTVYALTTSGLTMATLTPVNLSERPTMNPGGVVSLSSYLATFAPGSLFSIFGRNMGNSEQFSSTPLPTILGGTCVTLNNQPVPLLMASTGQINAQIPPELAAGRYNVMVRNGDRKEASPIQAITVTRYAPGILTIGDSGQPAIFHANGTPVTKDRPAKRDEALMMFATGLGVTKGGRVTAGNPAPADPLAVSDDVNVYFGDPRIREAEIIVEWSGLVPGYIGLYQINLRVPGARIRGDALPVTVRIGGVDSQKTGPVVPVISVD